MKFQKVSEVFNRIEQVSSRLEITRLLADLFKQATPNEAAIISYLSLGELNPKYLGTKFNFAEKSILQVVANLIHKNLAYVQKQVKQLGDIGFVIEQNLEKVKNNSDLSVVQVNKILHNFLTTTGTGSQVVKVNLLQDLLSKLDVSSVKYVARIILGKLRLGFSDMTLLDAFSWMEREDKSIRVDLENAYNISADIGLIIKTLKQEGLKQIQHMSITPGVPIRMAAAERLPNAKAIIDKVGSCVAQPKLDGFRLQVHIFKKDDKKIVRFFSRNLQSMSDMFPELSRSVFTLPVDSLVAEGEAIAYESESKMFLPFQETVKRRRKYDIDVAAQDVPLELYFFDVLYFNGKSLLDESHDKRRKILDSIFKKRKKDNINILDEVEINSSNELEKYFEQNVSSGLEGVVVKKIDSLYQPGKRNFNWIKLKREESGKLEDTIDCVILGYYAGHGKRAKFGIGALLVGAFNRKKDCFQTIAKIGTGLTDQEWKEQKKMCDKISVKKQPRNVECAKELIPDVWVSPEIVCLIRADEITLSPLHSAGKTKEVSGFALRFPRLMGYRPDKSAELVTTVMEIEHLYKIQFGGKVSKKRFISKKKFKGQKGIFD